MSNDVTQKVARCAPCRAQLPSLPMEPLAVDQADFPMQKVSTDLFDLSGNAFLVTVDRFSGYPWVTKLSSTVTSTVCKALFDIFCEFGFPRVVKSDGGPQFRGPFLEFCTPFNMKHEVSSPYNPRSNGLAEAAVKSMKGLLRKLDGKIDERFRICLLYTSPSPRDKRQSRMPSSA